MAAGLGGPAPPADHRSRPILGAALMVVLALGGMRNVAAVLGLGLATFVLASNLAEGARAIRAYHRATGAPPVRAVRAAVSRNRRMYGGYVVHVGVALAAIAITVSSSFARQTEVALERGASGRPSRATCCTYQGQRTVKQPQRTILIADVSVTRDGRSVGRLHPSLNQYPGATDLIGTPSIDYGALKDLYSSVLGFQGENGAVATFRFFLNPGVMWLWVGGGIMALGGLLAAWPARRRIGPLSTPERPSRALAEVG